MHRFFASPQQFTGNRVTLSGSEARHLHTVLRLKSGDTIEVLDGIGNCFEVKLQEVGKNQVAGEIVASISTVRESGLKITLGQAILKGAAQDTVIRKSVELGVHTLVPLASERSVRKLSAEAQVEKGRRWSTIAQNAAKQCGRNLVPEVVSPPDSLEAFCQRTRDHELKLMFWEAEQETRLADIAVEKTPGSLAVLIGPEGGWASSEVQEARDEGFQTVSLGPRILKAETAPVVILSLILYRWGDLGRCD